jgi:hypothetical protein
MGTGTYKEEDSTWGEIMPKTARHNSPDRNNYRSGICQFCDAPLGSKRVHGPLTCQECRILLEEDKEHEKEQKEYNDKRQAVRQARYTAQLAGTTKAAKEPTQETQNNDETKENDKESPPESSIAPNSPPRRSDDGWGFPRNIVRVTLAQLFQTDKSIRLDGTIQNNKRDYQSFFTQIDAFASIPEIQDKPQIPRWTTQLLQFQILFLQQRKRTKKKRMTLTQITPRLLKQNATFITGPPNTLQDPEEHNDNNPCFK